MTGRRTVGILSAVVMALGIGILSGCGAPCWHASDIPLEVVTLGTYGIACGARGNAREAEQRQASDVAGYVPRAGDPTAGRAAVDRTPAPRTSLNVYGAR